MRATPKTFPGRGQVCCHACHEPGRAGPYRPVAGAARIFARWARHTSSAPAPRDATCGRHGSARPGSVGPVRAAKSGYTPFPCICAVVLAGLASVPAVRAQEAHRKWKHEDTEVWTPEPPVVTPGPAVSAPPPSDAVVLFDGTTMDGWVKAGTDQPAAWTLEGGAMKVNKKGGNIETTRKFKDYQLHLEYQIPVGITGQSQSRGNSGLFLASTGGGDAGYELQILDNYGNKTYVNGMVGSLYKQSIPLANACRKPGEWQSYGVAWTAPRFNADGTLKSPAYATVFHNGVLVENHFELKGETVYVGPPSYKRPYDTAPIKLQAHGDGSAPISFRNIWVRDTPQQAAVTTQPTTRP